MATVVFTNALRRHVDCPRASVDGATVGAVLDQYFASHPAVRSYVVDEHGSIRRHIAVFVDGTQVRDRSRGASVGDRSEVYIMQALSGG